MSYRRYETKSSKRMLARVKNRQCVPPQSYQVPLNLLLHSLLFATEVLITSLFYWPRRRFKGCYCTVLVRDDVNFLHTDHRQTDMSHSVKVASVIKFYWLIFYSNGSNRTKRGARESGPGSRIQQFGSILEPQIRFRAARARNLRYRAQAVPCFLDKIVDTNGPIGSYLRFRSSGGDALRLR